MNEKQKSTETQILMRCENCGYRAVQSEINENKGYCPGCKQIFQDKKDLNWSGIHRLKRETK
jgi:predicted Zn-ribbon and HTH transcriptional regulator